MLEMGEAPEFWVRVAALTCVCLVLAAAQTEDFSGDLGAWNAVEGEWKIAGGKAEAGAKFSRLVRKDFVAKDVDVTAEVAYVHDGPFASSGIQVRLADDNTGYAAGLREIERGTTPEHGPWERPLLQLYRMDREGWQLLQEAKVMNCRSGELRKLRVQCKGPDIFVYYEDMETPVIRESDERYVREGKVALWKDQVGSGMFDNITISPPDITAAPPSRMDWSGVKGAVYVRSDAVNAVQMWEDYWEHTATLDRELGYAETYGFNMVQVYLHWIVWEKRNDEYLARIDDFLARAAKHGLKVNLVFWDDCGHVEPSLAFAAPVAGRHNSQMMPNPSHRIRDSRAELDVHRESFRDYVTGIARRFKDDPRIAFFQIYNEAMGAKETYRTGETDANIDTLLRWTREWIKATGTAIPLTATCGGFQGAKYSDFPSYHSYGGEGQELPNTGGGPEHLCTETLNRPAAGMGKVIEQIGGRGNGFVIWELMIGRDNCRFPWGHPDGPDEPRVPFHGAIYPDGHPWDVGEVRLLAGDDAFRKLRLFDVTYFAGNFERQVKTSVTPAIDFTLPDEPGSGSPDASAGLAQDRFSIRWTGSFTPRESGEFTFFTESDGKISVRIGDMEVIAGGIGKSAGKANLAAGRAYPVQIGYFHESGVARVKAGVEEPDHRRELLRADPRADR